MLGIATPQTPPGSSRTTPRNAPADWTTRDTEIRRVRDARRLYRLVVKAEKAPVRADAAAGTVGRDHAGRVVGRALGAGLLVVDDLRSGSVLRATPLGSTFRAQYDRAREASGAPAGFPSKAPLEGQLWRFMSAIEKYGPLSAKMAKERVGLETPAAHALVDMALALGLVEPVAGSARVARSPQGARMAREYAAMLALAF